jgi:hypothetical protein
MRIYCVQAVDLVLPGLGETCTNFLHNAGPGIIGHFNSLSNTLKGLSHELDWAFDDINRKI